MIFIDVFRDRYADGGEGNHKSDRTAGRKPKKSNFIKIYRPRWSIIYTSRIYSVCRGYTYTYGHEREDSVTSFNSILFYLNCIIQGDRPVVPNCFYSTPRLQIFKMSPIPRKSNTTDDFILIHIANNLYNKRNNYYFYIFFIDKNNHKILIIYWNQFSLFPPCIKNKKKLKIQISLPLAPPFPKKNNVHTPLDEKHWTKRMTTRKV